MTTRDTHYVYFGHQIHELAEQVPGLAGKRLGQDALALMSNWLEELIKTYHRQSTDLVWMVNRQTMDERAVSTITNVIFPSELAERLNAAGDRAVSSFKRAGSAARLRSHAHDHPIRVGKVRRLMDYLVINPSSRRQPVGMRISKLAMVRLGGVLEELLRAWLERSASHLRGQTLRSEAARQAIAELCPKCPLRVTYGLL